MPSLKSLYFVDSPFHNCKRAVFESILFPSSDYLDLPELTSIFLDDAFVFYDYDASSTLIMRSDERNVN